MDSDKTERLYTRNARFYERFFIEVLGWERQLDEFFRRSNYLRPHMKILDAGCGTGAVTKVLYSLSRQQGLAGVKFHAFDLTPAMLDIFREWVAAQGAEAIELRQANVLRLERDLPPDWREYDLVISSAMLEYIPTNDVGKALNNLRDLLKDEGVQLLFLTRRNMLTRWLGQIWWKTNTFEEIQIERELKRAGFNAVQFKPFSPVWLNSIMVVEASTARTGRNS